MGFRNFYEQYKVLIVMVPSIIGIHYGWYYLQQAACEVPLTEQPIVSVKTIKYQIF